MLNYWKATWDLDPVQCPCDIDFCDYLDEKKITGSTIFHFGTGNHHIVGLRAARSGADNTVLAITASREEYDDYIRLLIDNPRLGATYKAYFGDIYQIDRRLMPPLDFATLFHTGEFRNHHNDAYGALTDLEMALVCVDSLKPGGELHFFTGSFAYDVAERVGAEIIKQRPMIKVGAYKSLMIYRKTA
jgi:hypothetical protein